jgi:hypothetical protein
MTVCRILGDRWIDWYLVLGSHPKVHPLANAHILGSSNRQAQFLVSGLRDRLAKKISRSLGIARNYLVGVSVFEPFGSVYGVCSTSVQ